MLPLPQKTHIIQVTPDSPLCCELSAFLSHGFTGFSAEQWTDIHVRNFLRIGEIIALVNDAGKLLSACCSLVDSHSVEIISIVTCSNQRRQGHAQILLQHALSTWKNKGVESVVLVVRSTNTPAKNLYDTCGFQKAGIVRDAYTGQFPEDGVRMLKWLNNKESQ